MQLSALTDGTTKDEFIEDIAEEYEEIREEHYETLKVTQRLSNFDGHTSTYNSPMVP